MRAFDLDWVPIMHPQMTEAEIFHVYFPHVTLAVSRNEGENTWCWGAFKVPSAGAPAETRIAFEDGFETAKAAQEAASRWLMGR
jgi:hypothetical protein